MTEHVIYGLYHQDAPDEILYVGSWKLAGWQERIEQHRQGKSTMVRRGAEADGIPLAEFDGRILCRWETGSSPENQIINRYRRVGQAPWNSMAYAMSSEGGRKGALNQPRGARVRGGRKGGRIAGRKAVESGQIYQMATPEGRARGGRISGPIRGRKNVESGQIYQIATPESCARGGRKSGRKSVESGHLARISAKALHVRWHTNRGIVNSDCPLCESSA